MGNVNVVEDESTGVTSLFVAHDATLSAAAAGANAQLLPADLSDDVFAGADCLLVQLGVPQETAAAAAERARSAGAIVVLDPAPAQPVPEELIRAATVVTPNAHETHVLTGVESTDRASGRRAAERLLGMAADAAVVQVPGEGNLLMWGGGEYWLPHLPVDSVDPTGAGDAFAAAMGTVLCTGASLVEAGRFASVAAALTTTRLAASPALPRRSEAESYGQAALRDH